MRRSADGRPFARAAVSLEWGPAAAARPAPRPRVARRVCGARGHGL